MILSNQENVSTKSTSKNLWGDGLASNFINILKLVQQSQYVYNLYYQEKYLFENINTSVFLKFIFKWIKGPL